MLLIPPGISSIIIKLGEGIFVISDWCRACCCVAGPAGERRLPGRAGSTGAAAESRAGSLQGPHEQRERSETPAACSRTLLAHTLTLAFAWSQLLIPVCLRGCSVAFLLHLPESVISLSSTFGDRAAQTAFPACDFTAAIKCLSLHLGQTCTDPASQKTSTLDLFQLFICHSP